jgi:hypothetical protein
MIPKSVQRLSEKIMLKTRSYVTDSAKTGQGA